MSEPLNTAAIVRKIQSVLPPSLQDSEVGRNVVVALGARGDLPFVAAAAIVVVENPTSPLIRAAALLPTGMAWCEAQLEDPSRSLVNFVPYSRISRVVEESFRDGYVLAIELDADVRTQDNYAPAENGVAITRDRPAAVIFELQTPHTISDAQQFVMLLRNYMH